VLIKNKFSQNSQTENVRLREVRIPFLSGLIIAGKQQKTNKP